MVEVRKMTRYLQNRGYAVMWAISPLTDSGAENGRVFRKQLSAQSSLLPFYYSMNQTFIPKSIEGVILASHGLVHCDHRLLNYQAQELSILTSCGLVRTNYFVPPFNKWNEDTEAICREHGIKLQKFEDGWRSCEHEVFDEYSRIGYYLHPHCFNLKALKNWLK